MEWNPMTKAIWNFLEIAYRKGLLDEYLEFKRTTSDPHGPDGVEAFTFIEDKLSEADFVPLDKAQEKLIFILETFSKDDVIEALKMVLDISKPPGELSKEEM